MHLLPVITDTGWLVGYTGNLVYARKHPRHTVQPVLFACPLFRKFRDLGVFVKTTGRNFLVQPVKTPKLRAANI